MSINVNKKYNIIFFLFCFHILGDAYKCIDFADDIALLESPINSKCTEVTTRTAVSAEQLDLAISVPKTEYMSMAINCNPLPTRYMSSHQ